MLCLHIPFIAGRDLQQAANSVQIVQIHLLKQLITRTRKIAYFQFNIVFPT